MSVVSEEALNQLKYNVNLLMSKYTQQKQESISLKEEVALLKKRLAEIEHENKVISERYDTLKAAKVLTGNGEDKEQAKERINQVVREIDKCIALLNR
jgi:chromosome segregation ATPase